MSYPCIHKHPLLENVKLLEKSVVKSAEAADVAEVKAWRDAREASLVKVQSRLELGLELQLELEL